MRLGKKIRIRFGAVGLILAIVAAAVGSVALPAAAASGGSISGRVIDGGGNPLSGICVNVAGGSPVQTDLTGSYSLISLAPGSYAVEYSDCNPTPQYLTQWYLGHGDEGSADQVTVTDLTDTPLQDVTLGRGVAVSGTVADTNGVPIPGVKVVVNPTNPGPSTAVPTASDGTYATTLLPVGNYTVQFESPSPQWVSQYWNVQPTSNTANTLVLAASDGPVHGGINAKLSSSATVEGTVTGTGGALLSGICVDANVPNGSGGWNGVGKTQTAADGTYKLTALPVGDVRIHFHECSQGPYVDQWYKGQPDFNSSTPIVLASGADQLGIDAQLTEGIAVSGTITDANNQPIPNVNVNVNSTGPGPGTGTQTDANGNYTTIALPAGTYRVQFGAPDPQWAGQFWDAKPSYNNADILTLAASDGPVHPGINAQLAAAATITGTVTGAGNVPLSGFCVDANIPNGSNGWDGVGSTTTASDGTYTLGGLPAGDVRVHFHECGSGPYVDQWYNAQSDFNSATSIPLTAGVNQPGIDAQLRAGTSVSGTVTDGNGTAIPNVNVNVNPTGSGPSTFAQTDANGKYTTAGLPPGDYRVQFQSTGSFAGQYWNAKPSYNNADLLTLAASDGPVHGGVNATLTVAASISGTVTGSNNKPVGNMCVSARVDSPQGPDWVAGVNTAPDGTYTLSGLPPSALKVDFQDCNSVGPYVEQWWNNQPDSSGATLINLAPGDAKTGIDVQLALAGAITGTVTDTNGKPLSGICAQATTSSFVGGLANTDQKGKYTIVLSKPGDYRVQFVDCNKTPAFAVQWWKGQSNATDAQTVTVSPGQTVAGIDATLSNGVPGSISGKVVTARGTGMTTACVIAYLPTQFALFGVVQPDGTYTIPNVPSGTYALAFVGCTGGNPQPTINDPNISGVSYPAVWWNRVPLNLQGNSNGGPDPIAQGANLVTVTPGANLTGYDTCFGCTSITITSITPGQNSLTVAFTPPDLTASAAAAAASVQTAATTLAPTVTYTASCTSGTGGAPGSASGPGSPITVTGLTAGSSYVCQVAAAVNGTVVATSAVSNASVLAATISGATPAGGTAGTTKPSSASTTLPRTGTSSPITLGRAGALLLMLGLLLTSPTRRRQARRAVRF